MSRQCIGKRAGLALAVLLCGLALSGCGKKAAHVDPPPDAVDDKFPLVYPDPSTDPKPEPAAK